MTAWSRRGVRSAREQLCATSILNESRFRMSPWTIERRCDGQIFCGLIEHLCCRL